MGISNRVMFVQYKSYQLKLAHLLFNVPDHDLSEIANQVTVNLQNAKVGTQENKPFIIVAFSLGSLVTRELILHHLSDIQRQNLKGVIFIGPPLRGSSLKQTIQDELKRLIPAFNTH